MASFEHKFNLVAGWERHIDLLIKPHSCSKRLAFVLTIARGCIYSVAILCRYPLLWMLEML